MIEFDRLIKTADHLKKVKDEKFCMSIWKCKTAACAVGHACSIRGFRKLGLNLEKSQSNMLYPVFREYIWLDAVKHFYGLTENQAHYLFIDEAYPNRFNITRKQVIDRIYAFVEMEKACSQPT